MNVLSVLIGNSICMEAAQGKLKIVNNQTTL